MKKSYSLLSAILLMCAMFVSSATAGEIDVKKLPKLLTSPTNAGNEFYFSFPPCYEEESAGYENSCRVFVCSGAKQLITVEVPGKGWKMTKVATANDAVEFVIPTGTAQPFLKRGSAKAPPEQVYKGAAIHVFAKAPIICYGVTRYNYTSDGFLAVPVSSMGTEYIVAAWPQYTAIGAYQLVGETTISAAYDETVVQFTMGGNSASQTSGGLKPGKSVTFNMDKGDVLCFASDGDIQDVSGSQIKATKPVGVVSANQCANVPGGVPWCDYTSEMELPTYTWGKEYHVTPFYGRKKMPIIRIFAKEKNTKVYRDGQEWLVIPKSTGKQDDGYIERRADDGPPRAMTVSADKPIYIVEYNTGQADDNVSSDPFQMVLTPLEQYQKEIVFCTPGAKTSNNNFKLHYINLVYQLGPGGSVPNDLEFAVVVNGKFEWKRVSARFGSTPGMVFSAPVNGTTYACKQITLPGDGVYRVRANAPFACYAYGFSNYDSYGFPTSVALGNLEQKDSICPKPTFTVNCDGSVKDGLVRDFPDENDVRVNFGLIYMDLEPDQSYNYDFLYDKDRTLVAGETRQTDWTLTVIDPSKKARALLWFVDRNGNDTSIVIEYNPSTITLSPDDYLDFGLLKPNQTLTKTITLTNESPNEVKITQFKLKSGNQGFTLENVPLPFVMQSGEKRTVTFTFTKPDDGIYLDQIGIGDDCQFVYRTELKAEVASPIIEVEDYNYGTRSKNSVTSWNQLLVKNTGRVDLELYGDDHLTALAATPEFKIVGWNHTYPRTLKPGENLQLQVDYAPTVVGPSSANITFSSDAKVKDSISVIQAKAVEPGLIATPYDWKRKRIAKDYPATITLENSGSAPVTVQSASWEPGADAAFTVVGDLAVFANLTIGAGETKTFDVNFNPATTGPKTATIKFVTTTPGVSATSQLDGVGIIGRLKTTNLDFGTTEVGTQVYNRRQFKIESESWQYEDSVTITDLAVQAGGVILEAINGQVFGADGFRYNKSEVTLPITLQPNQSLIFLDSAEFLAQRAGAATASITTVSDAEAQVTSTWTGTGIVSFIPNPQITLTGGSGTVCVGTPTDIVCGGILSNGNFPFTVDSISIVGDALNEFKIQTPNPTTSFTVVQNTAAVPIVIRYTPSPAATGPSTVKLQVHGTNTYANNEVKSSVTVADVIGTGQKFTSTAVIGTNGAPDNQFKVEIGSQVTVPVTMKDPVDVNAGVTKLIVTATYNKRLLAALPNLFVAGGTFKISNATDLTQPTDALGTVRFEITNPSGAISGAGKLADMVFAAYLPNGNPMSDITLNVEPIGSACAVVTSSPGTVTINETCAFDLRKVDGSGKAYYLNAVSPNPIGNKGADISFSVGLKAMTELSLYTTSGSQVAIVAVGVLEPGAYSVKLPVDGLSSGSYILRMTSGQFTSEQQIIIAK